jgi:L1 cell adhesion molecule like protein
VLIYDLGGGFLDVSVISIKGGIFQVEGTANDSHLGGEDFDIQLVDDLAKKLKKEQGKDLSSNRHAMRRLRTACEGAKRTLSHLTEATIEILSLCEGFDFYAPVTRSYFEKLCVDLFHRTLEPVEKALIDAKMDKKDINEVVLVGGSTRIPKIQELLQQFFDGKELNKSLHHGEAVACGAAAQAALLSGYSLEAAKDFHLFEASSHSFGIEIVEGVMSTFIERNSRIPAKQTKIFTTKIQNQSSVLIQVYEGEGAMTRENSLLGKFILSGIYPAKRGLPRIEITFEIDANGMLTVTAADKSTEGRENKISQSINGGVNRVMEGKISDAGKMKLVLCENHPPLPTQILSQKSSSSSTGASRTDPILID